jgi:endonuclease YncB( thermonuclease family)
VTPEGKVAKAWLEAHLPKGTVTIQTEKDHREKYGRYLATLFVGGVNVNAAMIADGQAVPYDGGKRA